MALAEVDAEMAAWERYRSYVVGEINWQRHHPVYFRGDETSHGLWRAWKAARAARDEVCSAAVFVRRHKQYRWPK